MKKFLLLHYGFENPTPEIMEAWGKWFKSISDCMVEQGGFMGGKEINKEGSRDLPWDRDCLTGYNIIQAPNMEEAEKIAGTNPFISAIRVYEIRPE